MRENDDVLIVGIIGCFGTAMLLTAFLARLVFRRRMLYDSFFFLELVSPSVGDEGALASLDVLRRLKIPSNAASSAKSNNWH